MDELQDTPREEVPEEAEARETEGTETERSDAAEAVEAEEKSEERTLEESTHEPGARVEESQDFEQAEAVESAFTEAIESAPDESSLEEPQEAAGTPEEWDDVAEDGERTYGAKPGVPEGDSGWLGTGSDDPILAEATPKDVVEVPDGVEIKPAGEDDGTVGRGDHPIEDDPELGSSSGESEDENYYVDARGVIHSEEREGGSDQVELDHPGTGGRIAQEPDPVPEPGLSPGFDGKVAQSPEPGGTPPTPDVGEDESEDELPPKEGDAGGGVRETESEEGLPAHDVSEGGRDPETKGEMLGESELESTPEEDVLPAMDGDSNVGVEEGVREDDEVDEPPDWYLHEDKDGNITVVDKDGNPVDSPPIVYKYQGKTYVAYPGDEPAIAPDGTVNDPSKLIELPNYKKPIKDMYLHEDKDGNITVVDGDGKPVSSPPIVFTYQGKTYITYGDSPINPDGTIKDPSKLIELPDYKQDTKNMYLHEDKDGNITVVDGNGVPVDSPPIVFTYQGKTYVTYGDSPIADDGTIKDPNKLIELPNYKPAVRDISKKMYLHEDKDGNITVVDANGKPVDSPPIVYTYQGKTYVTYPGDEPAIAPDGTIKDPSKLIELSTYKVPIKDMYLHEDKDGKITVVDADGKPVNSPPIVFTYQGKTYVTYPGEKPAITPDGTINDPSKLIELPDYKQPIKDMYLHEDKDGNVSVVGKDGKPVDSPPIVFSYKGKYYAAYPGDEPFNPDGTIKDPSKLIELSNYKPPGWGQKTT